MMRRKQIICVLLVVMFCCSAVPLYGCSDFFTESLNDCIDCECGDGFVMKQPFCVDENVFGTSTKTIALVDTPEEFSWLDMEGKNWMTAAKDQGNCGSCWDFAAMGAFESVIKIYEDCSGLNPDLSEQYVLSCLPAAANNYGYGCLGGTSYKAFYYMMDTGVEGNFANGAIPESCFPYQASHDVPCDEKCPDWMDLLVPIVDCGEAWPGFDSTEAREQIKSRIYQYGPVAAAMNVTTDFIQWGGLHHSAIEYYPDTNEPWGNRLNHLIVIAGWKDDASISNGGYWICKNSWGNDWGYNGFFNIEYGGLFTGMWMAWVDYDAESVDWAPVADAGGLYMGEVGEEIEFIGTDSVDPEGPINSYVWDFEDGYSESGEIVTHSFTEEGIYEVELTVIDSQNQTGSDTALVGVGVDPLEIVFQGGFGFTISVSNPINTELTDLQWNVDLKGLIFTWEMTSGLILTFPAQGNMVFDFLVLGFGPGTISFAIENLVFSKKFFAFGPFVIMSRRF